MGSSLFLLKTELQIIHEIFGFWEFIQVIIHDYTLYINYLKDFVNIRKKDIGQNGKKDL